MVEVGEGGVHRGFSVPRWRERREVTPRRKTANLPRMSPASWSLIAFVVAVALSCTSRINVGLLALALSWVLGTWVAGLKPDAVAAGFPAMLFVTLVGVTLLFALAEQNGTLEAVARRFLGTLRDPRFVPPLIFLLGAVLSGVGNYIFINLINKSTHLFE